MASAACLAISQTALTYRSAGKRAIYAGVAIAASKIILTYPKKTQTSSAISAEAWSGRTTREMWTKGTVTRKKAMWGRDTGIDHQGK